MVKGSKPKRRIERVSAILDHNFGVASSSLTLHTCEDAKTLVRMLVDVQVYSNDTDTDADTWGCAIGISPGGQDVIGASITHTLDNDVGINEITRVVGVSTNYAAAVNAPMYAERVYRDIKAMRKLRAGDEITWYDICETDQKTRVMGIIYMWFKE